MTTVAQPLLGSITPFFIVGDLKQTVAFYCDHLGFDIVYMGPDDNPFFAMVERGGVRLMLKHIAADVGPMPNPSRHEWAAWDAYVWSPDPDRLAEDFAARGLSTAQPVSVNSDGLRGFAVTDPNGYVIYFGRPV